MKVFFTILVFIGSSWLALASESGFDRYQVIIDKHPFGEEPPDADETVQISLQESFAKNLRLSMLFEGSRGIRVGFVDSSKDNKSYILTVGESINGIELVEADIEASEALLKKGNEVALFKLKSDTTPEILSKKQQTSRRGSYADRRKAQLEKAAARKAIEDARPVLTPEELKAHQEAVQMDAIRTGKPPLPMALTPEMDAQLVSEGVLDPL